MRGIPILVLIGEEDSHTGTDRVRGIPTPLLTGGGDNQYCVGHCTVSTKQAQPVFCRTLYNLYKAGLTIEYCVSEEFLSRQLFGGKPSHSAHLY